MKESAFSQHTGARECPVALDALVEIERRDGCIEVGTAGGWHSPLDYQNSWKHDGGNCDIIRYRVLPEVA